MRNVPGSPMDSPHSHIFAQPAFTRRTLLKASSAILTGPLLRARAGAPYSDGVAVSNSRRLLTGWEYYRGNLSGPWDAWRTSKQAAGNFIEWQKVQLPHCFNALDAADPDHAYYQGPGWYRTTLQINNPYPNGRTLIHFEGAGQKMQLFVHLDRVGEEHIGGYDEFTVDITDAAARATAENKGKVPISIFCDNSRDLEMIPSSQSDFCLYGGLYRHVNLVYVPSLSLERVHVFSDVQPAGTANVSVHARLYNPGSLTDSVDYSIRVTGPDAGVVHSSSGRATPWKADRELLSFAVDNPQLWSPGSPSVYNCEVTLNAASTTMSVGERFGLRHFEFVDHGPFKLNGERLLLRGTCRHQDWAGCAGAVSEDLTRKEFQAMKDMGANFVRLGHYQQSPEVLDACDELGILVWEEIPWCRGGVGGERYKHQARTMLRNMIDQHRNHPSIILWGLGNENDWPGDFPTFDQAGVRQLMTQLNALAHELDPSRKTVIRRCDFAKDIPDVYSPSIWAGWYRGLYTEYKSSCEDEFKKVKHFIHAEWGGDSHAGRHSENPNTGISKIAAGQGTDERSGDYLASGGQARASRDGDWSETYVCQLFDWYLKEQETMPWLTGSLQWAFKDFPTPLRPENPVPRVNQKGLLERDATPKEGYFVFQSYWAEKPMVHIYGHTWPIRWGRAGERRWVHVYSNCDSVELFANGSSCGTKKRNSQDFPAAGLRWEVPFHEGENQLRAVGRSKSGSSVTDEISFQYQVQTWGKPARIEVREVARNSGSVTIEARLLDNSGVLCLDNRQRVSFRIAGSGNLIDNLGTPKTSRVVEVYNGRALISARTFPGESIISVQSEGVPGAFLKV